MKRNLKTSSLLVAFLVIFNVTWAKTTLDINIVFPIPEAKTGLTTVELIPYQAGDYYTYQPIYRKTQKTSAFTIPLEQAGLYKLTIHNPFIQSYSCYVATMPGETLSIEITPAAYCLDKNQFSALSFKPFYPDAAKEEANRYKSGPKINYNLQTEKWSIDLALVPKDVEFFYIRTDSFVYLRNPFHFVCDSIQEREVYPMKLDRTKAVDGQIIFTLPAACTNSTASHTVKKGLDAHDWVKQIKALPELPEWKYLDEVQEKMYKQPDVMPDFQQIDAAVAKQKRILADLKKAMPVQLHPLLFAPAFNIQFLMPMANYYEATKNNDSLHAYYLSKPAYDHLMSLKQLLDTYDTDSPFADAVEYARALNDFINVVRKTGYIYPAFSKGYLHNKKDSLMRFSTNPEMRVIGITEKMYTCLSYNPAKAEELLRSLFTEYRSTNYVNRYLSDYQGVAMRLLNGMPAFSVQTLQGTTIEHTAFTNSNTLFLFVDPQESEWFSKVERIKELQAAYPESKLKILVLIPEQARATFAKQTFPFPVATYTSSQGSQFRVHTQTAYLMFNTKGEVVTTGVYPPHKENIKQYIK